MKKHIFLNSISVKVYQITKLLNSIFPEYRGLGSSLTTAFSYSCAFVGVKTFVDLQESLGLHGTFWTYAIISAFGFLFALAFVQETNCTNLDEMMPTFIRVDSNFSNAKVNKARNHRSVFCHLLKIFHNSSCIWKKTLSNSISVKVYLITKLLNSIFP